MKALGTKTTLKLLNVLFEDIFHEFKEIELIKKAKTGKGSASNLINDLVKERIVLEKRIGKAKIICLNIQNKYVFLLKNLFDQEKMHYLSDSKLASVIWFVNNVKENSELLLIFGSCIDKTATERSDIDIIIVSNNLDKVQKERKKIEELFGERFNLHCYTKEEIKNKLKSDVFIQNALLKGVLLHGYTLGRELLSSIKGGKNLERLFFFNDRIKSALRNYLDKDYKAAKEILERTLEQMIYYLLSEKKIAYTSKKGANEAIKKLPEGMVIRKINKTSLKNGIILSEKFVLDILKSKILEGEGYA